MNQSIKNNKNSGKNGLLKFKRIPWKTIWNKRQWIEKTGMSGLTCQHLWRFGHGQWSERQDCRRSHIPSNKVRSSSWSFDNFNIWKCWIHDSREVYGQIAKDFEENRIDWGAKYDIGFTGRPCSSDFPVFAHEKDKNKEVNMVSFFSFKWTILECKMRFSKIFHNFLFSDFIILAKKNGPNTSWLGFLLRANVRRKNCFNFSSNYFLNKIIN